MERHVLNKQSVSNGQGWWVDQVVQVRLLHLKNEVNQLNQLEKCKDELCLLAPTGNRPMVMAAGARRRLS